MLVEIMGAELHLDEKYLFTLAKSASHRYKTYQVPKRSGGSRTIHHPAKELKAVQRWLLKRIISLLPVHEAATAYREGRNILHNAQVHANSAFVLRIDFRDFFPSLTANDLAKHLERNRGLLEEWEPADTEIFCKFVCLDGCLTIGAVTSPALSNTLCYFLDSAILQYCQPRGVRFTRYADDLCFSTSEPRVLKEVEKKTAVILKEIEYPSRLVINEKKTCHFSRKRRRVVTGLVLTPDGRVTIGRDLKRKLRTMIYCYEKLGPGERKYLSGMLGHCKAIEPDFINSLIHKFDLDTVQRARANREKA